jgi:hypothetical protein
MKFPILVREGPDGQFTAQAVGISEARATAATQKKALDAVQAMLVKWVTSGELTTVELPEPNLLLQWAGHAKDDPFFNEYLAEIERFRREQDELYSQEGGPECSDSSSTPTT